MEEEEYIGLKRALKNSAGIPSGPGTLLFSNNPHQDCD
jgi:hypothetical protein